MPKFLDYAGLERYHGKINKAKVSVYDTVADMLSDTTLVVGMLAETKGYNTVGDGFGGKYDIVSTGYAFKDYEELENGLFAVKQLDIGNEPKMSSANINKFINTALTYQAHASEFLYASDGTTKYKTATDDGYVAGTKYIDCSTLMKLVINGVPYSNSKYNGGNNEPNGASFMLPDDYRTNRFTGTRYTHEIAQYLANLGYAYYPNDDFTNVQVGDICFFSFSHTQNPIYFKQIDHCAIFMGAAGVSSNGTKMYMFISNDNDSTNRQLNSVFYAASASYVADCVICASMPCSTVHTKSENLLIDGNTRKARSSEGYLSPYMLKSELKPYTLYTVRMSVNDATLPVAMRMPKKWLYMNGKDFLYYRDGKTEKVFHVLTGDIASLTAEERSLVQVYNSSNASLVVTNCQFVEGWYSDIESSPKTSFAVTLNSGFSGDFIIYPDKDYISVDLSTAKNGSFNIGTYSTDLPIANRWLLALVRDTSSDYYPVVIHIADGTVSLISNVNNIQRIRLN